MALPVVKHLGLSFCTLDDRAWSYLLNLTSVKDLFMVKTPCNPIKVKYFISNVKHTILSLVLAYESIDKEKSNPLKDLVSVLNAQRELMYLPPVVLLIF